MKIDDAVWKAEAIAADNRCGYSQVNRWGPDYDCSSLIITALKYAGFDTQGMTYTGNMAAGLMSLGFRNIIEEVNISNGSGLQRGDILLCSSHTAFYCGNGKIVHASIDENGQTVGKTPGDQTGREICITNYYNKPWTGVYRLESLITVQLPQLRRGSKGNYVQTLQILLNGRGYNCGEADSDLGPKTEKAIKELQSDKKIEVDGIVGPDTWSRLLGG